MINLDYELKQNQGESYSIYKTNEKFKNVPNLCKIEGPNSSGKSTLLNVIALSFFGDEFDGVNLNLKNKIKDLVEPNKTEIKYRLEIDVDKNTKLVAEKKDFKNKHIDIEEIRNGKSHPLTYDNFKRKYLLIYDIPNNPTERLNELVKDVKSDQKDYHIKVSALKTESIQIYNEITSKYDPERLEKLRDNLVNIEEKYEDETKELEKYEEKTSNLKKYTYYKFYHGYKDKVEYFKKEILDKKDKVKKQEFENKSKNKNFSKNLTEAREGYNKIFGSYGEEYCKKLYEKMKIVLEKEDKYLLDSMEHIMNKNKKAEWIINRKVDGDFEDLLLEIEKRIIILRSELEKKDNYKKASLVQELINLLKKYEGVELELPNYDQKSFIESLKEIDKDNQKINITRENYDYILNLIKSKIRYEITTIKKRLNEIPKDYGSDEEDEIDPNEDIRRYEEAKYNYENELKRYDKLYREVGSPNKEEFGKINDLYEEYNSYEEHKLNEMIDENEKKLNKKNNEVKDLETSISMLQKEIERLEKQEPHELQDDLDLIVKINEIFSEKERDFVRYKKYLTNIENRKKAEKEEEELFGNLIFKYLGQKIGCFRHENKEFYAERVDTINQKIITDKGIEIHFSHLGTGQSQSAYLSGLLNNKTDKKMIVMFDEIAMMDDKSLKPIHKKMIEQYKNGKLAVGITVQRAEEISVEEIR